MNVLNKIEEAILLAIIKENIKRYPFLEEQYPYLSVINREYTGVGVYTNFTYEKYFEPQNINVLLSSERRLVIEGLENEVTYVLDITDGKINFLEIVTNGNDLIKLKDELKNFRLM